MTPEQKAHEIVHNRNGGVVPRRLSPAVVENIEQCIAFALRQQIEECAQTIEQQNSKLLAPSERVTLLSLVKTLANKIRMLAKG